MSHSEQITTGIDGEIDPQEVVRVIVAPKIISKDDGGSNVLRGVDGTFRKVVACVDDPSLKNNIFRGYKTASAVQAYLPGRDRKIYIER